MGAPVKTSFNYERKFDEKEMIEVRMNLYEKNFRNLECSPISQVA